MPPVVAFFNQKGGTAKTTSTMNVAAALAERGARVLAVDLDPQASLTMAFGVDVTLLEQSVYDLLLEEDLSPAAVLQPTTVSGVDLLPSHPDLATAEMALVSELERERLLAARIGHQDLAEYDIIVIDAPPALGLISINILVAATTLIIPVEPHPLSLLVLPRLFDTVTRVRRLNPALNVLGFLPTKVHSTSRLAADMLATLQGRYPEVPILTPIPLSVKGAESVAMNTTILEYSPRSPLANAYRDVAEHILSSLHLDSEAALRDADTHEQRAAHV